MDIKHAVLRTIRDYEMLKKGDRVVVAVSGGPDSVFLLYALDDLKRILGVKLYVCHMDHGIRGAASRLDAEFVRKLAGSHGLRAEFKKLSGEKKRTKLSTEERLRHARYAFFKSSAKRLRANVVATGHTLDDQAETVLMRMIKGASLKGLAGIRPVRNEGSLKYIRPLIEIEKKEIERCLRKEKIPCRLDRTNLEDRYLRNRVRNRVIPYLSKINPRIKRSIVNMSFGLREDLDFIEEEKRKRRVLIKGRGNAARIKLRDILLQPAALRKEILRAALIETGANVKKLTFRHWKDIDRLLVRSRRGKGLDLPDGVRARRAAEEVVFERRLR